VRVVTGRRVNREANNLQRPLSRRERETLEQHLAAMPAHQAEAFRALTAHPGGRARLRNAGYVSRPTPADVAAAARRGAEVTLPGGVPVDLGAIVRGLRSSERGRAALRRRGITP
jgi:hypothetical protein